MAYLFVHFIGEEECGEQIYFSVSPDGLHWTDLIDGPALISDVGEMGVRDPFIIRNCIDKKFYIIATDLRIANNKGWERAQYEGSRALIVWESEELVHWGGAKRVEIARMKEWKAGCVWAPEALYDEEKKAYFVYWASMVEKKQRIYAAWTKDFHEYSDVHLYIEKDEHIIDTTMAKEDGVYYRFSACGAYSGTLFEKGLCLDSDEYVICKDCGIAGTERTEGPIIIYLQERQQWCLYVDDIGNQKGYIPFVANRLSDGEFVRLSEQEYDFGLRRKRHGSILAITEEEYEKMLYQYGKMQGGNKNEINYFGK